jgi:SSS family solute:Na+ symporter
MREFGLLNWSIVGVYMLSTLCMGYWFSRKITTAEHYYLGQRPSPWWAIGGRHLFRSTKFSWGPGLVIQ